MAKEKDKILDILMNMDFKSKDPFNIVHYSGELPEELKQFIIESPTCAKGDQTYMNNDVTDGNINP